jgi:hypothetical protein
MDGCPELSASLNYITIFQLGKAMKRLTCCLSKTTFNILYNSVAGLFNLMENFDTHVLFFKTGHFTIKYEPQIIQ